MSVRKRYKTVLDHDDTKLPRTTEYRLRKSKSNANIDVSICFPISHFQIPLQTSFFKYIFRTIHIVTLRVSGCPSYCGFK